MKRFFKSAMIAMIAMIATLGAFAAPSHLEGHTGDLPLRTNDLGRAYVIQSIYIKPDQAASNMFTVAVLNIQDTNLTATNTTLAAVTYQLTSVNVPAAGLFYVPDDPILVPDGAVLSLSAATGTTNHYVVTRGEQ